MNTIDVLPLTLIAIIALASVFAYLNGVLDSGSVVATAISSLSLAPRAALALASVAAFVGPFLFGTAVAATIGTGLIAPGVVTPLLVATALLGAVWWNLLAIFLGLPTSSSHALVGGLVGAALAAGGPAAVLPVGLALVLVALVVGPLLGLVVGYHGLRLVILLARGTSPAVNRFFRRGQIVTVVVLALSQGTNNAQKTMGVIILALLAFDLLPTPQVPLWVIALSAGALALGVGTGGSRVIRRLGTGLYRVRPVHAFSAQTTAAAVILAATLGGGPISTGQVMSASIIGVGAAHRLSSVRWQVAADILTAWLLTMPVAGLLSASAYWPLSML
jgi:inorganic phosphate transporter, PiT family